METLQLIINLSRHQAEVFKRFLDNLEKKGFSNKQREVILKTYLESSDELCEQMLDDLNKSKLN